MINREKFFDVVLIAGAICLEVAPPRFEHQPTASVSRKQLRELEAALVAAGFDMDEARRRLKEIKHKRRAS